MLNFFGNGRRSEVTQSYLVTELDGFLGTPVINCCLLSSFCSFNTMSSKKRKDKSLDSSSKSFKQRKEDYNIGLLNCYFLEEEFKAKFAKAFRFVPHMVHVHSYVYVVEMKRFINRL